MWARLQAPGAQASLLRLPHARLAALRSVEAGSRAASGAAAMTGDGSTAAAAAAAGPRPKVLVLTGPTAVGKTKASLALAQALGGEIISADSVQVYRRLDVGSDKVRRRRAGGQRWAAAAPGMSAPPSVVKRRRAAASPHPAAPLCTCMGVRPADPARGAARCAAPSH